MRQWHSSSFSQHVLTAARAQSRLQHQACTAVYFLKQICLHVLCRFSLTVTAAAVLHIAACSMLSCNQLQLHCFFASDECRARECDHNQRCCEVIMFAEGQAGHGEGLVRAMRRVPALFFQERFSLSRCASNSPSTSTPNLHQHRSSLQP